MHRLRHCLLVAGAVFIGTVVAAAQSPGRERGRDDDNGPLGRPPRAGPPGRFEPGRLLPPPIRAELDLTEEQERQLDDLEREVKGRLLRILTDTQQQKLREHRRPPPGGFDGPPDDAGPPDIDAPPAQRSRRSAPKKLSPPAAAAAAKPENAPAAIQWYATWDSGLREARRTNRPILLVSAAPHCAGVSGIW